MSANRLHNHQATNIINQYSCATEDQDQTINFAKLATAFSARGAKSQ